MKVYKMEVKKMWCNSWILKDFIAIIFKMFLVCGGIYWIMYAFVKVTYKIHKKRMLKNK